jgi:hypothetical protein
MLDQNLSSLHEKMFYLGETGCDEKVHEKTLFAENRAYNDFLMWNNCLQERLLSDIQPPSSNVLPRNDDFRSKWISDSTDVVPGKRSRRTQLVTL